MPKESGPRGAWGIPAPDDAGDAATATYDDAAAGTGRLFKGSTESRKGVALEDGGPLAPPLGFAKRAGGPTSGPLSERVPVFSRAAPRPAPLTIAEEASEELIPARRPAPPGRGALGAGRLAPPSAALEPQFEGAERRPAPTYVSSARSPVGGGRARRFGGPAGSPVGARRRGVEGAFAPPSPGSPSVPAWATAFGDLPDPQASLLTVFDADDDAGAPSPEAIDRRDGMGRVHGRRGDGAGADRDPGRGGGDAGARGAEPRARRERRPSATGGERAAAVAGRTGQLWTRPFSPEAPASGRGSDAVASDAMGVFETQGGLQSQMASSRGASRGSGWSVSHRISQGLSKGLAQGISLVVAGGTASGGGVGAPAGDDLDALGAGEDAAGRGGDPGQPAPAGSVWTPAPIAHKIPLDRLNLHGAAQPPRRSERPRAPPAEGSRPAGPLLASSRYLAREATGGMAGAGIEARVPSSASIAGELRVSGVPTLTTERGAKARSQVATGHEAEGHRRAPAGERVRASAPAPRDDLGSGGEMRGKSARGGSKEGVRDLPPTGLGGRAPTSPPDGAEAGGRAEGGRAAAAPGSRPSAGSTDRALAREDGEGSDDQAKDAPRSHARRRADPLPDPPCDACSAVRGPGPRGASSPRQPGPPPTARPVNNPGSVSDPQAPHRNGTAPAAPPRSARPCERPVDVAPPAPPPSARSSERPAADAARPPRQRAAPRPPPVAIVPVSSVDGRDGSADGPAEAAAARRHRAADPPADGGATASAFAAGGVGNAAARRGRKKSKPGFLARLFGCAGSGGVRGADEDAARARARAAGPEAARARCATPPRAGRRADDATLSEPPPPSLSKFKEPSSLGLGRAHLRSAAASFEDVHAANERFEAQLRAAQGESLTPEQLLLLALPVPPADAPAETRERARGGEASDRSDDRAEPLAGSDSPAARPLSLSFETYRPLSAAANVASSPIPKGAGQGAAASKPSSDAAPGLVAEADAIPDAPRRASPRASPERRCRPGLDDASSSPLRAALRRHERGGGELEGIAVGDPTASRNRFSHPQVDREALQASLARHFRPLECVREPAEVDPRREEHEGSEAAERGDVGRAAHAGVHAGAAPTSAEAAGTHERLHPESGSDRATQPPFNPTPGPETRPLARSVPTLDLPGRFARDDCGSHREAHESNRETRGCRRAPTADPLGEGSSDAQATAPLVDDSLHPFAHHAAADASLRPTAQLPADGASLYPSAPHAPKAASVHTSPPPPLAGDHAASDDDCSVVLAPLPSGRARRGRSRSPAPQMCGESPPIVGGMPSPRGSKGREAEGGGGVPAPLGAATERRPAGERHEPRGSIFVCDPQRMHSDRNAGTGSSGSVAHPGAAPPPAPLAVPVPREVHPALPLSPAADTASVSSPERPAASVSSPAAARFSLADAPATLFASPPDSSRLGSNSPRPAFASPPVSASASPRDAAPAPGETPRRLSALPRGSPLVERRQEVQPGPLRAGARRALGISVDGASLSPPARPQVRKSLAVEKVREAARSQERSAPAPETGPEGVPAPVGAGDTVASRSPARGSPRVCLQNEVIVAHVRVDTPLAAAASFAAGVRSPKAGPAANPVAAAPSPGKQAESPRLRKFAARFRASCLAEADLREAAALLAVIRAVADDDEGQGRVPSVGRVRSELRRMETGNGAEKCNRMRLDGEENDENAAWNANLGAGAKAETAVPQALAGGDASAKPLAIAGGDASAKPLATAGGDTSAELPATAGGDASAELPVTAGDDAAAERERSDDSPRTPTDAALAQHPKAESAPAGKLLASSIDLEIEHDVPLAGSAAPADPAPTALGPRPGTVDNGRPMALRPTRAPDGNVRTRRVAEGHVCAKRVADESARPKPVADENPRSTLARAKPNSNEAVVAASVRDALADAGLTENLPGWPAGQAPFGVALDANADLGAFIAVAAAAAAAAATAAANGESGTSAATRRPPAVPPSAAAQQPPAAPSSAATRRPSAAPSSAATPAATARGRSASVAGGAAAHPTRAAAAAPPPPPFELRLTRAERLRREANRAKAEAQALAEIGGPPRRRALGAGARPGAGGRARSELAKDSARDAVKAMDEVGGATRRDAPGSGRAREPSGSAPASGRCRAAPPSGRSGGGLEKEGRSGGAPREGAAERAADHRSASRHEGEREAPADHDAAPAPEAPAARPGLRLAANAPPALAVARSDRPDAAPRSAPTPDVAFLAQYAMLSPRGPPEEQARRAAFLRVLALLAAGEEVSPKSMAEAKRVAPSLLPPEFFDDIDGGSGTKGADDAREGAGKALTPEGRGHADGANGERPAATLSNPASSQRGAGTDDGESGGHARKGSRTSGESARSGPPPGAVERDRPRRSRRDEDEDSERPRSRRDSDRSGRDREPRTHRDRSRSPRSRSPRSRRSRRHRDGSDSEACRHRDGARERRSAQDSKDKRENRRRERDREGCDEDDRRHRGRGDEDDRRRRDCERGGDDDRRRRDRERDDEDDRRLRDRERDDEDDRRLRDAERGGESSRRHRRDGRDPEGARRRRRDERAGGAERRPRADERDDVGSSLRRRDRSREPASGSSGEVAPGPSTTSASSRTHDRCAPEAIGPDALGAIAFEAHRAHRGPFPNFDVTSGADPLRQGTDRLHHQESHHRHDQPKGDHGGLDCGNHHQDPQHPDLRCHDQLDPHHPDLRCHDQLDPHRPDLRPHDHRVERRDPEALRPVLQRPPVLAGSRHGDDVGAFADGRDSCSPPSVGAPTRPRPAALGAAPPPGAVLDGPLRRASTRRVASRPASPPAPTCRDHYLRVTLTDSLPNAYASDDGGVEGCEASPSFPSATASIAPPLADREARTLPIAAPLADGAAQTLPVGRSPATPRQRSPIAPHSTPATDFRSHRPPPLGLPTDGSAVGRAAGGRAVAGRPRGLDLDFGETAPGSKSRVASEATADLVTSSDAPFCSAGSGAPSSWAPLGTCRAPLLAGTWEDEALVETGEERARAWVRLEAHETSVAAPGPAVVPSTVSAESRGGASSALGGLVSAPLAFQGEDGSSGASRGLGTASCTSGSRGAASCVSAAPSTGVPDRVSARSEASLRPSPPSPPSLPSERGEAYASTCDDSYQESQELRREYSHVMMTNVMYGIGSATSTSATALGHVASIPTVSSRDAERPLRATGPASLRQGGAPGALGEGVGARAAAALLTWRSIDEASDEASPTPYEPIPSPAEGTEWV